ncbi:MAG: ATP-binding protein [Myxococcota bacterium]
MRRDALVTATVVATIICGWVVMLATGWWLVQLAEPANTRKTMIGPLNFLSARLNSLPRDTWDDEAQRQTRSFGYPVRVIPRDTLETLGDVDESVSDADVLVLVIPNATFDARLLTARVLTDDMALVIGPIPDEPPPPAILIGLMLLLVGLVTFGGSYLLTVPLARRMRALATTAADIQEGRFTQRAEEGPDDIVGSFARSFNAMAATVQEHIERQEHLLHAVAHELRTPLSRVRFALETIAKESASEAATTQLENIDTDLDEIDQLVEELLTYARFGSEVQVTITEDVDLHDVAQATLRKLHPHRRDVEITVEGNAPTIHGDWRYVQRVVGNLVQNAIRHATHQITIHLSEATMDGRSFARLVVQDDGKGVPTAYRTRIFEPFARVEESRSRRYGGAGLGLAIVKRIVEHHQGRVSVDDAPSGGARFELLWPSSGAKGDPPQ